MCYSHIPAGEFLYVCDLWKHYRDTKLNQKQPKKSDFKCVATHLIRSACFCCHRATVSAKTKSCHDIISLLPWLGFRLASLFPSPCSGQITGIALGVPAGLIFCLVLFFLGVLYHRGLAIRRKRAMRRYLESGEVRGHPTLWAALEKRKKKNIGGIYLVFWQSFEPLGPGEKGTKAHARILKPSELKKIKALGSGVFGTVNKVCINLFVFLDIHWFMCSDLESHPHVNLCIFFLM